MKINNLIQVYKSKENILWKRLLYRDFGIHYNKQHSYNEYIKIKSNLNVKKVELTLYKTLTQEMVEYIGSDNEKWDWEYISCYIKLTLPFVKKYKDKLNI